MKGVTLAETNMNFRREEQWFFSSEGANIHQTKYTTGAGYAAYAFAGSEIQKRSYPTSFGGQWQNKGYELIEELKLVENARRVGEKQSPSGHWSAVNRATASSPTRRAFSTSFSSSTSSYPLFCHCPP